MITSYILSSPIFVMIYIIYIRSVKATICFARLTETPSKQTITYNLPRFSRTTNFYLLKNMGKIQYTNNRIFITRPKEQSSKI